jgi:hypothetical protein
MSIPSSVRWRSILALALIVPVPSIGVAAAMFAAPGPSGHAVFVAGKVWLVVFPAMWYLLVDRGRASRSPATRGGLALGATSGMVMALVIIAGWFVIGAHHLDAEALRSAVREMGLARPESYLAGAAAWTFANSLVEEYVYRWFVLTRCERLVTGRVAILAAAAIFTVHHVIALSRYLEPGLVVLASTGVFLAGVVWGALYRRTRSIWPSWISHVLADVAVFAVGWLLLFG